MKPFVFPALLVAALPFLSAPPANVAQGAANACVDVGGASIWGGIGWNHIVYLTNRCEETVVCTVTTNVDPEPHVAEVTYNTTVYVPTAMNSLVSVFVPSASCEPLPSP